jgi:NADP-reducing hydrogenase subunit HndB
MSTKKFKSIDDFNNYKPEIDKNKIKILVGMGSCGIAAGADIVFDTFKRQIKNRGLKNIELKKVGCLGLCFSEPNVEIIIEGMPNVLYGKVDESFSIRILEEHIGENKIINHRIFDKPYFDILNL